MSPRRPELGRCAQAWRRGGGQRGGEGARGEGVQGGGGWNKEIKREKQSDTSLKMGKQNIGENTLRGLVLK